jgi:hypothetical protein
VTPFLGGVAVSGEKAQKRGVRSGGGHHVVWKGRAPRPDRRAGGRQWPASGGRERAARHTA